MEEKRVLKSVSIKRFRRVELLAVFTVLGLQFIVWAFGIINFKLFIFTVFILSVIDTKCLILQAVKFFSCVIFKAFTILVL